MFTSRAEMLKCLLWALLAGVPISLLVYFNVQLFVHGAGILVALLCPYAFWQIRAGVYPPDFALLPYLLAQVLYYFVIVYVLRRLFLRKA